MIRAVKFVSIPVRNQDEALAFYRDKLGLIVVTDQPFDDTQRWIELRPAKGETCIVLFTTDEHKAWIGSSMNLSLACDDVEGTYETLRERGVEFLAPPTKEHWGVYAILNDQDNNRIMLSSSR